MTQDTRDIIAKKLNRIRNGGIPRVLDLFAGAGGLSLGFFSAGFEIAGAVEIDAQAAKTHAMNFFRNAPENVSRLHGRPRNIVEVEPEDLMAEFGFEVPAEAVDVIIGGPPCQAFARVGRAKLREVANHPEAFLQDPRGNLYLRFIHYVRELKPLAILMENVPDALNYGGHNVAEETCEVLTANGIRYRCSYTLLNSAFYGVPQMRERMFLLALVDELDTQPIFPDPTNYIVLPEGYEGTRSVALRAIKDRQNQLELVPDGLTLLASRYYTLAPKATSDLPAAVSAEAALSDLPPIYALEMLSQGKLRKGAQDPLRQSLYPNLQQYSEYAKLMRRWRSFQTKNHVTGHIIRFLPRDYKLFARLKPGDQYPQAYRCAIEMFKEHIEQEALKGENLPENFPLSSEDIVFKIQDGVEFSGDLAYLMVAWKNFVPPYSPDKFPNKWRKMERNFPARTLMAHIGKDSYSHIHYDSRQARTISVREAARLMSFPDGFIFSGKMNAAFKQAGNAVPPLLAYRIAVQIKRALGQEPSPLIEQEIKSDQPTFIVPRNDRGQSTSSSGFFYE